MIQRVNLTNLRDNSLYYKKNFKKHYHRKDIFEVGVGLQLLAILCDLYKNQIKIFMNISQILVPK